MTRRIASQPIKAGKEGLEMLPTTNAYEYGMLIQALQHQLPQISKVLQQTLGAAEQGSKIESPVETSTTTIRDRLPIRSAQVLKLTTELLAFRWKGCPGDLDELAPPGLYWINAKAIYQERRTCNPDKENPSRSRNLWSAFHEQSLGIARDIFVMYMRKGGETFSAFFVLFRISDDHDFQAARHRQGLPAYSLDVVKRIQAMLILRPDHSNRATAEVMPEDPVVQAQNPKGAAIVLPLNPTINTKIRLVGGKGATLSTFLGPKFLSPSESGYRKGGSIWQARMCLWDLMNPHAAGLHQYYPGDADSSKTAEGQGAAWGELLSCIAGARPLKGGKEMIQSLRTEGKGRVKDCPVWTEVTGVVRAVIWSVGNRMDLLLRRKWGLLTLKESNELPPIPDQAVSPSRPIDFKCEEDQVDPLMGIAAVVLTGTQRVGEVAVSMWLEPSQTTYELAGMFNQFYALRCRPEEAGKSCPARYPLTWSFWQVRNNAGRDRACAFKDSDCDSIYSLLYFSALLGVGRIEPIPLNANEAIDRSSATRYRQVNRNVWITCEHWGSLRLKYDGEDSSRAKSDSRQMFWKQAVVLDRELRGSWHYADYRGGYYSRFYSFDRHVLSYLSNFFPDVTYVWMLTSRTQRDIVHRIRSFTQNMNEAVMSQIRQVSSK